MIRVFGVRSRSSAFDASFKLFRACLQFNVQFTVSLGITVALAGLAGFLVFQTFRV